MKAGIQESESQQVVDKKRRRKIVTVPCCVLSHCEFVILCFFQLLFLKALDSRAAAQQDAVVAAQTKVSIFFSRQHLLSHFQNELHWQRVTNCAASDCREGPYGNIARSSRKELSGFPHFCKFLCDFIYIYMYVKCVGMYGSRI